MKAMQSKIPKEVTNAGKILTEGGYKAYLVGGCVRDLLRKAVHGELVEPKDWDIATDATPEVIQKLFPESVYENNFGTVGVKTESEDPRLKIIEITTFRVEDDYSDKRHPDAVRFAKTIEEDLSRRDFTINALALSLVGGMAAKKGKSDIVDPYGGQADLKNKIIRTVGDPRKRFEEDALRLMRAVRLAAELGGFSAESGSVSGWEIEHTTMQAIKEHAGLLEMIAKERIRDEFVKIIMTPRAAEGIVLLEDTGLLKYIIPELKEGIGCGQNKHHIYTVFDHNIRALNYAVEKNYSLEVRLAALLHDVGKPRTKRGEGPNSTFYNHEVVGARMTAKIMDRLHFSKEIAERVLHLVRFHLFYYNVGEVTEAGVRRFLQRVGEDSVDDLFKVREADRIGSGVPKAVPYKLRHLRFMLEKVKRDPIHPKMLKIKGDTVMELLHIPPGPKVGQLLSVLLEEVLDDPTLNTEEYLHARVKELAAHSEKELKALAERAKEKKEEFESGIEENIKRKYYIK